MDKKDKPSWMKNFDDTYAAPFAPGYWNKPLTNGGQKVADTHGGYRLAHAHGGGRGGHSETSSLYSRYTTSSSTRSERKRSRRIALCVVLTIVALILAALVGLLVYFLFMNARPKTSDVGGVQGSVRVLNVTYHDDMANTSSEAFRQIAEPFCEELDSYVARSNYSDQYEGCKVTALRNVADVSDCQCLGVKKGNVMVMFDLRFNGTNEEDILKKDVYYIIENGVKKVRFDDVIYVMLRHFLVDIRYDWKKPYDLIAADVTLPVYNLNYSNALTNNQSEAFLSLARPFCREVDEILTNEKISWLSPRYDSCVVTAFSKKTSDEGKVAFTLRFKGHEPRPIQQGLLYILLSGARNVVWHGQWLKMIGDLVITPFGATNRLRPENKTDPERNLTYLHVSLPVFNLTLTPELGDPRSPYYINLTTRFCEDMARFYKRSSLKDRFYSCKVLGFRPNPNSIEVRLGFEGEPWSGLKDSVEVVIRAHAPDRIYYVFHLFRVGDLDIILDRIWANGLEIQTSLRVINLTFTSDLKDPASPEFLHHAVLFCKDLKDFYQKSAFADRFVDCGVTTFTPKPVRVHFYLVFRGTSLAGLTSSHIDVIKRHAQAVAVGGGWTAYLVGDLLVLPEHHPYPRPTVLPTNITITTTTTTTATATDIAPTTTLYPPGDIMMAIITAHLYNFTFDAQLLDPGNFKFKFLQQHFCNDVSRVYLNSFLSLSYRGCEIELFRPAPDEVVFNLYFDLPASRDLEWGILYVLKNRSPKVNLTLSDRHIVEVIHLGDLYLTPRDIILKPTPSTSFSLPSLTSDDVSPSPTWTPTLTLTSSVMMSSTIIGPDGPDDNVTLRYPLFNFTFPTGVGDPDSEVFRQYQRLFCLEIQQIFKASRNFYLLYDGCGINEFGYDKYGIPYVDFYILFNTGYTEVLRHVTIDTLEGSRAHLTVTVDGTRVYEILPIGGLLLILDNSTLTSSVMPSTVTSSSESTVMTSTVHPGGVLVILYYETYQLYHTKDLEDWNSPRFLGHRQKVCSDLQRWFTRSDSPFYFTYNGCELTSFSSDPEGVTFTILLRTDDSRELGYHVRNYLEDVAPKRNVPYYQLLEVGDLLLIVNRSRIDVIPTPVPSGSYTDFSPTPMTTSIVMTSTIEPTPTTSDVEPTSSWTVITVVPLIFGLADFYYTSDLNYDFSDRYRYLEARFCADMARFYRDSPLRGAFRGCQIDEFTEMEPRQPHQVAFTLKMQMAPTQENENLTINTILTQTPRIKLAGYETIQAGDLYLILKNFTHNRPPTITSTPPLPTFTLLSTIPDTPTPVTTTITFPPTTTTSELESSSMIITTPSSTTTADPTFYLRMSFEVKNMTWSPYLNITTSERFIRHNDLFCAEIDSYLPGPNDKDFSRYMGCKIDIFNRDPLRVNFSLQFDSLQGLDVERVQRWVVSLINEHARRLVVDGLVVHEVGDLLINIDSIYVHHNKTQTTINTFDAIAFEYNYTLYPSNFTEGLLNANSYDFRSHSYEFCADMDGIFEKLRIRNIRKRYQGCYVNRFGLHGGAPTVTFTLVFNGTEAIDPDRLNGIIVFSRQQSERNTFFPMGTLLVSETNQVRWYYLKQGMWSTHPYPYTSPTTPPVITYVKIKLDVYKPDWRVQLADSASAYYRDMSQSFCDAVSGWIEPEIPPYLGCEVLGYSNNPMTIEADLTFLGEQRKSLHNDVDTILLESPDREQFGNIIALRMGKFFMYEESLVIDQRTGPSTSGLTSPGVLNTTTATTPSPTPTKSTNPCQQPGEFHPHPSLCDRWVQCIAGGAFIEIPCSPGSVYINMQCVESPPGFQCTPAAG